MSPPAHYVLYAAVATVVILLVAWLLQQLRRRAPLTAAPAPLALQPVLLRHCCYWPVVLQCISSADAAYVRQRCPSSVREWQAERRRVLRGYLAGLREDHRRLAELGRAVARLAPKLSREREMERLRLGFRFRVLYLLVCMRVWLGMTSPTALGRLTETVGNLAANIEGTMSLLGESALARLRPGLTP